MSNLVKVKNVTYIDDDPVSLDLVRQALAIQGYKVTLWDSRNRQRLWQELRDLVGCPLPQLPNALIIDGHNLASDGGYHSPSSELSGLWLAEWLRFSGLPAQVKLILYSNDFHLIERVRRQQPELFDRSVAKSSFPRAGLHPVAGTASGSSEDGGILALLATLADL